MRGTSTFTRRGAVRVIQRETKARQAALEKERAERQAIAARQAQERRAQAAATAAQRRAQAAAAAAQRREDKLKAKIAADSSAGTALHGMHWTQAERFVLDWMRLHGFPDAALTPAGADKGIDVRSSTALAQVKHQRQKVGLEPIQRHWAVARSDHKRPVFFSAAGYTRQALEWAKLNGVECYVYPPMTKAG